MVCVVVDLMFVCCLLICVDLFACLLLLALSVLLVS